MSPVWRLYTVPNLSTSEAMDAAEVVVKRVVRRGVMSEVFMVVVAWVW